MVMHIHHKSSGKKAMIFLKGKLKAIIELEISPVIPKISNIFFIINIFVFSMNIQGAY